MRVILLTTLILSSFSAFSAACLQENKSIQPWQNEVDTIVNSYINTFKIPGVVVLVGNSQDILLSKSFGKRASDKDEVNSVDTIYDLASITKLFTATAIMQLIEKKKVYLGGKVKRYFPYHFVTEKKQKITVEDLLRHNSGFKPGVTSGVFTDNLETTWDNILSVQPSFPYRNFKYSDINYLMLGKLVEKVSKLDLNDYIRMNILEPLKMEDTQYLAYKDSECKYRCAPTKKKINRGHVHDPTSFKLGGISGHAGLFSTAKDLAKFATMVMNKGELCGKRVLSAKSIHKMISKKANESRGLGFDITSSYSNRPRGDYFAKGLSFGHTGFTGTSIWIDPTIDTYLIVLSNTVYSDNEKYAKSGFLRLITELANIVGQANSI